MPAAILSSRLEILRVLVLLFFARRASNWSASDFSLAFSALALWIASIRTLLFLKTLPLHFKYMAWYMWRSIFLASRYFERRRRNTRWRLNHSTLVGSLASLVPRRLPYPVWRPRRFAACSLAVRAREWICYVPCSDKRRWRDRSLAHLGRFSDHKPILDEFADVLSRIRSRDIGHLIKLKT